MAAKIQDFLLLNNLLLVVNFYFNILSNEEGETIFRDWPCQNPPGSIYVETVRKLQYFVNWQTSRLEAAKRFCI